MNTAITQGQRIHLCPGLAEQNTFDFFAAAKYSRFLPLVLIIRSDET